VINFTFLITFKRSLERLKPMTSNFLHWLSVWSAAPGRQTVSQIGVFSVTSTI